MVSDLPALKASVATFASSCANKLRGQGSCCKSVTVFVGSNRLREDLPQYGNGASTTFATPTADTLEITNAALRCLEAIYVPGIMYKRSGVMVGDITPACPLQLDMFDTNTKRKERKDLMRVMDSINQHYGLKTLHLAVEDTPISYGAFGSGWHVKCEHRSPNYLTDINDILTVRI